MVGKTLDQFAPIGPYFVSADQIDPNKLRITTRVNGETRQDSNTSLFIFNPQKVISWASRLFTLNPGDIIFTGTPSGVIVGMPKDKQVWLKAGDKIESEIEKPRGAEVRSGVSAAVTFIEGDAPRPPRPWFAFARFTSRSPCVNSRKRVLRGDYLG